MELAEDAELAHESHVSLREDFSGRQWLVDDLAGEEHQLQIVDPAWSLHFDDEGFGWIKSGSVKRWLADELNFAVFEASNGDLRVQQDGISRPLSEVLSVLT